MDNVVAIEIELADGTSRYFITWGRIQHPVDPKPVCELVLGAARRWALGGEPASARLCNTLREAADTDAAPYFYECFLTFAQQAIPFGDGYEAWRHEKADRMREGREIAYCGWRERELGAAKTPPQERLSRSRSKGATPHAAKIPAVRPIPRAIDNALVLRVADLCDARPTGSTKHFGPRGELPGFSALALARYGEDDGVYLFYCDEAWNVVTDTYHDDLEGAVAQAEYEFGPLDWSVGPF